MDTKTEIIGAVVLGVIVLGLVLWYMSEHPAPYVNQPTGETPGTTQAPGDGPPLTLNEDAAYYEIKAVYPSSTSLRGTASATADAKAVEIMKQFEVNTITNFKEQGNFAHLTHDDIQMLGLDQRKESLDITYQKKSGTNTISYVFVIYMDTLGAHPNAYYRTFTFDTKTGTGLEIDDVFVPSADYLSILSQKSRAALPAVISGHEGVGASQVDTDYISRGTTPDADNFGNWYIDGTSLVVLYPPYQVAPYAAGTLEVKIPFSQISSSVKSQYR